MPANLRSPYRLEDGLFTGEGPADKAQSRFAAASLRFSPWEKLEALRWGSGYLNTALAHPNTPFTSTANSVGYGTAGQGGFFQALCQPSPSARAAEVSGVI